MNPIETKFDRQALELARTFAAIDRERLKDSRDGYVRALHVAIYDALREAYNERIVLSDAALTDLIECESASVSGMLLTDTLPAAISSVVRATLREINRDSPGRILR